MARGTISLLAEVAPRDRWERPALSGPGEETWSYARLHQECTAVASLLSKTGLSGHSAVVVGTHRQMVLTSVLAAVEAGVSPLVQDVVAPRWQTAAGGLDADCLLACGHVSAVRIGQFLRPGWEEVGRYRTLRVYCDRAASRPVAVEPGIRVTTSGSTGAKKIVSLAVSAALGNMRANALSLGLTRESASLVVLPLHYSYGLLAQCGSTLLSGGHVVFAEATATSFFRLPQLVSERGITDLFLVPALARLLVQGLSGNRHWSEFLVALRILAIGGAPVSATVIRELAQRLPGTELLVTYGLAEAGPRVTTLNVRRDGFAAGTVGKPIPGVSLSIVEPGSDHPAGAGQPGQVCVDSPYIMDGYVVDRNPAGFIPGKRLVTSDRGYLDERGHLVLQGASADRAHKGMPLQVLKA